MRSSLLALAFAATLAVPAVGASPDPAGAKLAPWLESRLVATGSDSFLVLFDDEETLGAAIAAARRKAQPRREVYDLLRHRAGSVQARVRAELTRLGIPFQSLYIINGLAVKGDLALARRLAHYGEVVRIVGDPVVHGIDVDLLAPVPTSPAAGPEWGVTKIEADKVWSVDGNRGEGIVVASADTGVDWTHAAIKGKYRGWNGTSANHDFNWFDAILDVASPIDPFGHGTHTAGTMVGDDGAGNQIGVAPGAKWIACRNMDAGGNGKPSTYIACNQFFLAPYPHGGNPELDGDPSKSPDIVNNSWGCPTSEGCDANSLRSSFEALRAAGILAVVSAGNSGSSCSTVFDPPAIYDQSFVVGATDSSNFLAGFSSRGPVTIDGSGRLRPDVAAPGVGVRSSIPGGSYSTLNGTSMASPHVAGAAALLWAARPQVRGLIGITRCLISQSARSIVQQTTPQTCGGTTGANRPNNLFGFGLIDAYDAIHLGPDGDGDGIANACDCAPADPAAFNPPQQVQHLRFEADKQTMTWDAVPPESGPLVLYDAIRGDLDTLRSTHVITAATCLGGATSATSLFDPQVPPATEGAYYLIEARDHCAGGFGDAGVPRTHTSCP